MCVFWDKTIELIYMQVVSDQDLSLGLGLSPVQETVPKFCSVWCGLMKIISIKSNLIIFVIKIWPYWLILRILFSLHHAGGAPLSFALILRPSQGLKVQNLWDLSVLTKREKHYNKCIMNVLPAGVRPRLSAPETSWHHTEEVTVCMSCASEVSDSLCLHTNSLTHTYALLRVLYSYSVLWKRRRPCYFKILLVSSQGCFLIVSAGGIHLTMLTDCVMLDADENTAAH